MRKQRPPGFEMMPMDGWVRLAPGESVAWDIDDPPPVPSIEQCRQQMRHVRGMVLATGFSIENNAILVQLADAFGTTDRKMGGQAFAERDDNLRADNTGVERRLEDAKPIIRRVLPQLEADRLIQDLAEYRRLRHLCAHRPSWLESIWDADAGVREGVPKGRSVGFKLFIADTTYIWEIDTVQLQEWADLLNRCTASTDRVLRTILQIDEMGQPLPAPPP